jgi:hypothetical protein
MAVTIRKNDVRAANLILLSLTLSVIGQVLHPPRLHSTIPLTRISFYAAQTIPLLAAFAFSAGIRAGHRWVKITYTFLLASGLIVVARHFKAYLDEPFNQLIFHLATIALRVWAIVIMLKDLLTRQPAAVEPTNAGADLGHVE